jgi:predicted permease
VPIVVFVLGATLSKGPASGGSAIPAATVIGALVAKLLVVPAFVLALLLGCMRIGLVPLGDGLLPLVMLVVGASPTAMNINLIATLQGTGQKEVASIMFYEYLLAIITVSLVASVGLVLFV